MAPIGIAAAPRWRGLGLHRPRELRTAGVRLLLPALVSLLVAAPARAADTSAFRHVLELAGTIGPRKTGTDADNRAIGYVMTEMTSGGLTVTRQDVGVVPFADGERTIESANVIGDLPGTAADTIVVTAHHDSRSAGVPGANDDASGVAVLLEVARVMARRPRHLSYRFIVFCAEEEGLLGSRFYVEHGDLSHVREMIALEMVGRGELLVGPVPEPPPLWAQEQLLRAARETGAVGVVARPLWTVAPRFLDLPYSSDHEVFLAQRIPAFLMLGTFPAWAYHTSEDGVAGVRQEALDRAVVVLGRILQDLDERVPRQSTDAHYLPLMLFGRGVLLPSSALSVVSVAALLGWGLLALSRLRIIARPRAIVETVRVIIVTGASTAIGLSGPFVSGRLVERMHHVRFPWMAHQGWHVALGILSALFTSWLGLNLFRRIKPTVDPGPYLAAALLVPVAWVAAALNEGLPEIAVFMAVPTLLFVASRFFESVGRKLALGLGAVTPFFLLLTLRDYKTLIDLGGVTFPALLQYGCLFAVVFPFALYLAHVASFQDCLHSHVWWWLSGRFVGLSVLAAALVLLGVTAALPAYDYRTRPVVKVRERVDLNGRGAVATLRSREALGGVRTSAGTRDTLDPMDSTGRIELPAAVEGVEFEASAAAPARSGETLVSTRLKAPVATDRISYVFASRTGFQVAGGGDVRHRYTFTDVVPRRDPAGTFRLVLPPGGDLSVELRADFETDLLGLGLSSDLPRVFVHQATVEGSRRLLGPSSGASPTPAGGGPGRR